MICFFWSFLGRKSLFDIISSLVDLFIYLFWELVTGRKNLLLVSKPTIDDWLMVFDKVNYPIDNQLIIDELLPACSLW